LTGFRRVYLKKIRFNATNCSGVGAVNIDD
jgi:hypothetical protein